MKYRKVLIGFIGMSMALFFASQVFAQQAPIEGWDKAKLGMSIEELKESYKEEAKFFKMWEGKDFWEENTPPENKLIGCTRLSTSGLEISLGLKLDVDFWFIDNKLWDIEIHIDNILSSEKVEQFLSFLTHKYGKPSYEEPDIFGNSYEWYRGSRKLMVWTYFDSEGEKISSIDVFYTDGELSELYNTRYDEWNSKRIKVLRRNIEDF
jgi:hypothetical protein